MTDRVCISRPPSVEETRHYIDTLRDAVTLRLESGSHPEDAMCTAMDLIDAWVAVHVDGSAESIYHARDEWTIKTLRAELKELQALHTEDKERWESELREREAEVSQLAHELAQLEDDLLEGRAAGAKTRIKERRATAAAISQGDREDRG